MATLKIADELLQSEPTLLSVLEEYFDSIEEIATEYPKVKIYVVQKDGIPTDNTQVDCVMKYNMYGKLEVESCGVLLTKIYQQPF